MRRPRFENIPDRQDRSLGLMWFMNNLGSDREWFGHGGAHMYGWRGEFRAYPRLDMAIVVTTNEWPMTRESPATAVIEFAADWLATHAPDAARARRSHAWKRSYVLGLVMVDQVLALGSPDALTPEMMEGMAAGAVVSGDAGADPWDADGFRAAASDLLSIEPTLPAIQAFMRSDRLQVHPAELDMLFQDIGGVGQLLVGTIPP